MPPVHYAGRALVIFPLEKLPHWLLEQKIKLINLQVGQKINLLLKKENNKIFLSRLSFSLNKITNVYLFENSEQNYNIKIINKILEKKNYLAKGFIKIVFIILHRNKG